MANQPPLFVRFSLTRGLLPSIDCIFPLEPVTFLRVQPMALLGEQAMTQAIIQDMWGQRLRDYTIINIGLMTVVLLEDSTIELLNTLVAILTDTLFTDPPPDFILGRSHHATLIQYNNWRVLHHDHWIHLAQPRAWELYLAYPLGAALPGPIEDYFGNFTDRYLIDDFPTNPHP